MQLASDNAPKDTDYAEKIVSKLRQSKKSIHTSRQTARSAIAVGNYTDNAKEVFAKFLAETESGQ